MSSGEQLYHTASGRKPLSAYQDCYVHLEQLLAISAQLCRLC